jgi:hypothetical protein
MQNRKLKLVAFTLTRNKPPHWNRSPTYCQALGHTHLERHGLYGHVASLKRDSFQLPK